uniref:Uncharacterized protein n=1 Tax=Arundo donax TaxID=35708 RepID=A0A0A9EFJ5_ARUDO
MTLTIATRWKAMRHPVIPRMEPVLLVSCSQPKAVPRLSSSVESATSDWTADMTRARPMPFRWSTWQRSSLSVSFQMVIFSDKILMFYS